MLLDKDYFEGWMLRLMERFDRLEENNKPPEIRSTLELDGERLLDNTELCQMLNLSKRSLQRYRSLGELPYEMIYHRTYYRESEVKRFIERNIDRFRNIKKLRK